MTPEMTPALQAELAPTGKLRVGINHQNFLLVNKGSMSGEPSGVVPDLARELAKRVGVPLELVNYQSAGSLADSATAGAWEVAFLGAEPQRANVIAFSAAYLEIPATYLVPAGSPIKSVAEVDREGVRIAVAAKSAYDLWLTRNIKHATLVRADGIPHSFDAFVEQKLEVLSGLKPRLITDQQALPGSRMLEGQFTAVQQAIGTPKNRPYEGAAKFLREFSEDVKASGFVAKAIERHKVPGVNVAPKA
jgi:polar amino acid transport system substrate-binding protein